MTSTPAEMPAKLGGYEFFEKVLKRPKYVVAPMVNQSELAFRMLCRKYGSQLCYTPMFHSRLFAESSAYRERQFTTCEGDRPLVVQFCANDPQILLTAAKLVEDSCDAVDINLGCPQNIAKRGNYGSFLLTKPDTVRPLVSVLHQNLKIPVFCKIRLLPDLEETLTFARMLEEAGCQLLTVHGRTKEQKGKQAGMADWKAIRAIRHAISIPVIANGGVACFDDIQRCLDATGADGVMSAYGILKNPAFFDKENEKSKYELAGEYFDLCLQYETVHGMAKAHVFKLFRRELDSAPQFRDRISRARDNEELRAIIFDLRDYLSQPTRSETVEESKSIIQDEIEIVDLFEE